MKIILAPAKNMQLAEDSPYNLTEPVFINKAEILLNKLKKLNFDELKEVYGASDKIVQDNLERLKISFLDRNLSPAILSYVGIAYKHLSASVFTDEEYEYLNTHLRILSGLYGVLKPFDGIIRYRLEMQSFDLYDFWKDKIYKEVKDDVIINLASKEYSKCIEDYLESDVRLINIDFVEEYKGKLVTKATYAKMARGEMVRYMAENRAEDINMLKSFNRMNYQFKEELSDDSNLVFERNK